MNGADTPCPSPRPILCVCVCVVSVIAKRPVVPPSVVDGRSRNPLYYYYTTAVNLPYTPLPVIWLAAKYLHEFDGF